MKTHKVKRAIRNLLRLHGINCISLSLLFLSVFPHEPSLFLGIFLLYVENYFAFHEKEEKINRKRQIVFKF